MDKEAYGAYGAFLQMLATEAKYQLVQEIATIIFIATALALYLIPVLIATLRKHRFALPISLISPLGALLLGIITTVLINFEYGAASSFLPWFGALVWSTWPKKD